MMATVSPSLLVPKPGKFRQFMAGSILVHGLLVGAGLLYGWLNASPRLDLNQKPIEASLVRLGKPRDPELLPRKEELPSPPPVSEPTPPSPASEIRPASTTGTAVSVPSLFSPKVPNPRDEGRKQVL